MMSDLNLPSGLVQFLTEGKRLEYDPSVIHPGVVGLKPLNQLELGVVWIDSEQSPLSEDDPHAGEKGYYEVPAISLTAECEAYNPAFLLLWLPREQLFGTWDCDHWDVYVFPARHGLTSWQIPHRFSTLSGVTASGNAPNTSSRIANTASTQEDLSKIEHDDRKQEHAKR